MLVPVCCHIEFYFLTKTLNFFLTLSCLMVVICISRHGQGFLYSSTGGRSGLIRIAPISRRLKKFRPIYLCRLPTLITILAKHIVINTSKITVLMQYITMSIVTTVQCKFQQIRSICIMLAPLQYL